MHYDYCFHSHILNPKAGNIVLSINYMFMLIINKYKGFTPPCQKITCIFLHLCGSKQVEVAMKKAFLCSEFFNWKVLSKLNQKSQTSEAEKTEDAARELGNCQSCFHNFSCFSHCSSVLALCSWLICKLPLKKWLEYFFLF